MSKTLKLIHGYGCCYRNDTQTVESVSDDAINNEEGKECYA